MSVALLVGGVALSYVDRHLVPVSGWDFSDVFEEVTFMAIPAVGAVDLDTVRGDLARVVQTALEPAHVSVWTSRRE